VAEEVRHIPFTLRQLYHEDDEIFKLSLPLEALPQMQTKDHLQRVSSMYITTRKYDTAGHHSRYHEKAGRLLCTCGVFFL
jgi:hypothetical protein